MPIEFRKDNDEIVWVRNPFTHTITYFTHLHKKRSGFSRRAQSELLRGSAIDETAEAGHLRQELEEARRNCPFCPGNEAQTPEEVLRVLARAVFPERSDNDWLIRSVPNLIPRIPECCTGGRNESYVVIEDPRHFADDAQRHDDLFYSALLPQPQFEALLAADVEVARLAYSNPAVRTVLIRKNQGRESGASQPHLHNQVIGSDVPFPTVSRECEVTGREPRIWQQLVSFARQHGFLLEEQDGCYAYFCPFGVFPHSYEVVCLHDWTRSVDVPASRWRTFAGLLYRVLTLLGPIPLDYEIHEGPGLPLHAHVNARHFPYSNIGGTLNLPSTLAASVRQARLQRGA
jgi:UDPglucose--hexose-1-phosphate uridylyltransferase